MHLCSAMMLLTGHQSCSPGHHQRNVQQLAERRVSCLAGWQRPHRDDFALHIRSHAAGDGSRQACIALQPLRAVPSRRQPALRPRAILLQHLCWISYHAYRHLSAFFPSHLLGGPFSSSTNSHLPQVCLQLQGEASLRLQHLWSAAQQDGVGDPVVCQEVWVLQTLGGPEQQALGHWRECMQVVLRQAVLRTDAQSAGAEAAWLQLLQRNKISSQVVCAEILQSTVMPVYSPGAVPTNAVTAQTNDKAGVAQHHVGIKPKHTARPVISDRWALLCDNLKSPRGQFRC